MTSYWCLFTLPPSFSLDAPMCWRAHIVRNHAGPVAQLVAWRWGCSERTQLSVRWVCSERRNAQSLTAKLSMQPRVLLLRPQVTSFVSFCHAWPAVGWQVSIIYTNAPHVARLLRSQPCEFFESETEQLWGWWWEALALWRFYHGEVDIDGSWVTGTFHHGNYNDRALCPHNAPSAYYICAHATF